MTSKNPATANTTTGSNDKSHRPVTWKPEADSSPHLKDAARSDGHVHLDITDDGCLCGCNQKAARRFRPGHDAALKGKLTRAELHGAWLVIHEDGNELQIAPMQLAAALNTENHAWDTALAVSVVRAKEAAIEAAERAKKAAEKRAAEAKEKPSSKLDLAALGFTAPDGEEEEPAA